MGIETASLILSILGLYFALGIVFALAFIFFGASKIDPAAKRMPIRVRFLILPGTMLLWPLMAVKWIRQTEPPIS